MPRAGPGFASIHRISEKPSSRKPHSPGPMGKASTVPDRVNTEGLEMLPLASA